MNQSRLAPGEATAIAREEVKGANAGMRSQLPLLIIISSLVVVGIWFFQQTSVRHLDSRIHQLQRDINKLPKSVPPTDRLGLEKEQISLERDRINIQNGVYNLLFQGISVGILGGLVSGGWWYLRRAEAQFQQINNKQITDRFSQAISHLASDRMEVRLGGIYTLERLGQESPAEHWTIIEVLTAFVRERSSKQPESILTLESSRTGITKRRLNRLPRISTDVQAVMTVLNRRDVSRDLADRPIELRESNLRAADLNGVELWGADLWKVNLREAQLWQAKLAGAFLGRANLSEASLWKANLEGAYLWKANLEGANLSEANLGAANLEGSNLQGANLQQTNLINADLRLAIGLTHQQLSKAICDETTQLPDYIELASGELEVMSGE